MYLHKEELNTGPPNGPVLFCWLASVVFCRPSSSVVVCNATGGRSGRPLSAWTVGAPAAGRVGGPAADTCTEGQSCYVPLRRHLV